MNLLNEDRSGEMALFKKHPVNYAITIFLITFGILAIVWLTISILHNPSIQLALLNNPADSGSASPLIIAFLVSYGIIVPILTLGIGFVLIFLGIKLLSGNIRFARWAQFTFFWLAVGIGIFFIYNIFMLLSPYLFPNPQQQTSFDQSKILLLVILFILFWLVFFWNIWLNRNILKFFRGREALNDAEVRFAWYLLVPTLAVFVLVAARPLEQTFIRSLTDKRFASQEVPNYVGLTNYTNLLSVRFDVVGCRLEKDSDNCLYSPNGSLLWASIDREILKSGFRTAWTIKIPFQKENKALAISGLDSDFIKSIGTTLVFTIVSVSLELMIALFMALTVNSSFRGRGMMRAVMLVPWAIPTVISAKLWDLMLKDTSAGIINRILMDLQIVDAPQAWLSVSALQLPSAIMVDVWKTAPFMALLLLAGLQTIPSDLYESTAVDGANNFQQFFAITLPLLKPTIGVALVFRTLDSLRVFDLFNVLFGRQQLSMATYNYEMLVNSQKDGYASAVSIIIFLLISIFAFFYVRMLHVEAD